jgi:hypothetical protein
LAKFHILLVNQAGIAPKARYDKLKLVPAADDRWPILPLNELVA